MVTIPPEIVNGVLVNVISATGRMIVGSASSIRSRRSTADLDIARWFDTYQLTGEGPDFPAPIAAQIERGLRRDDTQAVLQELLAARLTDIPEVEISRIRAAWELSFVQESFFNFDKELAGTLFDYYDSQIGELVARLEADAPPVLALIRSDAYSTRILCVLNAIERHAAALSTRPNQRTEASFLVSYRSHVIDQHGKLEPPDFERRRRVPISDIYVPTSITEDLPLERTVAPRPVEPPSLTVFDLAGRLDRTVLLGDPGGGKTTAANVLMHLFAGDETRQIPFLITLREYAAEDPPARSVVGHIEHALETFYQCPAPSGLVDLLLLTGRAMVIFDGLDELLDTSRRADVTARVERFCAEYPQPPVLVTSRAVGYDQARLNDRQFTCYRLEGFKDEQVGDYAKKWFAQDPEARADEANTFLTESENVPDLRTNPLLLSLMCILYRGEGSLPRDRAGVYEKCAELLLRKWDERRRIRRELRAGHLVEPTLRRLAWWLFTRDETQAAVTERELVIETATFMHGRGFESEDEAIAAAREFVEFSRGRMWVFSDAGTTSAGEKLYAFTHRTFLEYFAAAHLAYDSDTPERLARTVAPHVARGEWEVVGELAVQIKDGTSTDGARRVYAELLGERRRRSSKGRSGVLQFLARTLRSVDPSPPTVRTLANAILRFLFSGDPDKPVYFMPLAWLLASCGACQTVIDEEISATIAALIASDEPAKRLDGLRFAVSLASPLWGSEGGRGPNLRADDRMMSFWQDRTKENVRLYASDIIEAAAHHTDMRCLAVEHNLITVEKALQMNGALLPLLEFSRTGFLGYSGGSPLMFKVYMLAREHDDEAISALTAVGMFISSHPRPPWVIGSASGWSYYQWDSLPDSDVDPPATDPLTFLGFAGVVSIFAEFDELSRFADMQTDDSSRLGPFSDLYAYMDYRRGVRKQPLPELPLPDEFKQVFHDWAEGKVNFTAPG
jgi:NACHT domain